MRKSERKRNDFVSRDGTVTKALIHQLPFYFSSSNILSLGSFIQFTFGCFRKYVTLFAPMHLRIIVHIVDLLHTFVFVVCRPVENK